MILCIQRRLEDGSCHAGLVRWILEDELEFDLGSVYFNLKRFDNSFSKYDDLYYLILWYEIQYLEKLTKFYFPKLSKSQMLGKILLKFYFPKLLKFYFLKPSKSQILGKILLKFYFLKPSKSQILGKILPKFYSLNFSKSQMLGKILENLRK